jgi:WhiB family redox-sensing transcriptional regulator
VTAAADTEAPDSAALRKAHADAWLLRKNGLEVPEPIAALDREYERLKRRAARQQAASQPLPVCENLPPLETTVKPLRLQTWQEKAACRGADLSLFFGPEGERQPERDRREARAKAICAAYPVRVPCGDYAVWRPEKAGVWGEMGEEERTHERKKRQRAANRNGASHAA